MVRLNQEEGRYRVLLIGIGNNTEEEKDSFCHNISKSHHIPFAQLKGIADRCPVILKKNLSLKKAEGLAKTFKSFGAVVSVEERRDILPISLEFQELVPHRVALESSSLQKTQRGTWSVTGRVKNISDETLSDTWVLIQLFEELGEFVAFEETPLPINPLPSGESSPFKVIFEGDLLGKSISIAFKHASGQPIPALDKRKRREWLEVNTGIDLTEPPEEILMERERETPTRSAPLSEREVGSAFGEETGEEQADGKRVSEESLLQTFEPSGEIWESSPSLHKRDSHPGAGGSERIFRPESHQKFTSPVSEEVQEEIERALGELEPFSYVAEPAEESPRDACVFEEAIQLPEDISEGPKETDVEKKAEEREEERAEMKEPPSFSWIENFRDAVEAFYRVPRDPFSIWFEECRNGDVFKDSLHALLTILVHSRFDQGKQPIEALKNTQGVFGLIVQPNLLLDGIPPLEGTPFASGEVWRDLFQRALPKIQQIGNAVFGKNKWKAGDLERLIQVIPHTGQRNSRMAIQWINELIPDVVEVDFSDTPISIGENLYRVAARLGIVDPHFDYYQDRNSMGNTKIQSFATTAFPHHPVRIEKPMSWIGSGEDQGGHCFPIEPSCEGCLFESFCPRLYIQFNPSEKGIRE